MVHLKHHISSRLLVSSLIRGEITCRCTYLVRAKAKQEAAQQRRGYLSVNNCILTTSTIWLCVQAHGDKKGGTPQDGVKTDKGKILKVSWDGGADLYNAAKLEELFQKFGKVEDIVIKTRKSRSKGSAIVVMGSKEAAVSPVSLPFIIWEHYTFD